MKLLRKMLPHAWIPVFISCLAFHGAWALSADRAHALYNAEEVLPIPDGQDAFPFLGVTTPSVSASPGDMKPLGVGEIAETTVGDFTLWIRTPKFEAPCDLYLCLYPASFTPSDFIFFTYDGRFVLLSDEGFVPWKTQSLGGIDEQPLGSIAASDLPVGEYYFFMMMTPAGSLLDYYYIWATSFEITYTNGHAEQKILELAYDMDAFFWEMLGIFSNDFTILPFDEAVTIHPDQYSLMTAWAFHFLSIQPDFENAIHFLFAELKTEERKTCSAGNPLEHIMRWAVSLFDGMGNVVHSGRKLLLEMWYDVSQEKRDEIYRYAKKTYPNKVGATPEEFYNQVQRGELKFEANSIYRNVTDVSYADENGEGTDWARERKKQIGDIVVREGIKLMADGGRLIADSARKINPVFDKAVGYVEELDKLAKDEDYVNKKVQAKSADALKALLVEYGMNEDMAETLANKGVNTVVFKVKKTLIDKEKTRAAKIEKSKALDLGCIASDASTGEKPDDSQALIGVRNEPSVSDEEIVGAMFLLMLEAELRKDPVITVDPGKYDIALVERKNLIMYLDTLVEPGEEIKIGTTPCTPEYGCCDEKPVNCQNICCPTTRPLCCPWPQCCTPEFPHCCSNHALCCQKGFPICCGDGTCCSNEFPVCCPGLTHCCSEEYPTCCPWGCCPAGWECCPPDGCMPKGATCCGDGTYCEPGYYCGDDGLCHLKEDAEPIVIGQSLMKTQTQKLSLKAEPGVKGGNAGRGH